MASSHDAAPAYAELHCLSNFSFLRGASHPEELVQRAAQLGYRALAITDECSLAGVVRAHLAAKEHAIDLIIGAEIKPLDGPRLVLLSTDREGYGHLSQLITHARRAAGKGGYRLRCDDLAGGLEGCLALLLPEISGQVDMARLQWLARQFDQRCWLAVERLFDTDISPRKCEAIAARLDLPLVATGNVHMHVRGRRALQDTLTAIRLHCKAGEAGLALYGNGERHLRPRERLARIYPAEWLEETVRIAGLCHFSLDSLRYEYPREVVPPGVSPSHHLRRLTEDGMRRRWPEGAPHRVREIIEHELRLIAELRYEHYFLTVHDIVQFARGRGILCQGRGSAANSAVCYCLGITEVDPARMSLLFERFISRERNEPPDIDVDFEHERREEVIQYIYGKYGRERAALAATVITYRPRSAIRDVGKALGLEKHQIDRMAKSPPEHLRAQGFDSDNPLVKRWLILADQLIGFPRHLSQHVGGFVISAGPLCRLVPIENAAMPGRTVIQWDKDDLEALGLMKVDILGLGMLTALRRAIDLVNGYRQSHLTMADIPPEDPETYRMIRRADTVGVFQIESRAQMAMLPRLKPRNFYDLVIEIALVRPGPIQGQMVHPYLRRRQGLEPVSYPNEAVRDVLERTLGVPIFQEQVMQIAMVAAGFSPGEADQLRRSMAAWHHKGLQPFQQRLREGMRARGYSEEFAQQICRQIEGFAEYGFPESHSASFALLAYTSAWLKRHEPAAFTAALLNSQPMGFYAPAQLVQDARRHGVEIRPVDVRVSDWDCALQSGRNDQPALRLGLCLVKELSRQSAERLIAARRIAPFTDVQDLLQRAGLSRGDLERLAAAGALAGLAGHRHLARWQALGARRADGLMETMAVAEAQPLLRRPTEGEDIVEDYAHLGLTLGRHPLALLRGRLSALRYHDSCELQQIPHGRSVRAAGLVITRQRPATASGATFLTLEDEHGTINVVVWRDLAKRQRAEVLEGRLLGVTGKIEKAEGVMHLVAAKLEDHTPLLGRLVTESHDFH
jgi:error-prone DNA polymerase